jgi:hypothetical protein
MSIQAQQYPVFKPSMRIITNITNGNPATVTTSFAHGYSTGLIVRLILPSGYGMEQADQLFSDITIVDTLNFTIDLDTTLFQPFVTPGSVTQYPQAVPIGEINSTVYLATMNVLPYGAL